MFSTDKSNSKSVVLLKFQPFNFYQLGWQRKRRVPNSNGSRVAKEKKGSKGKGGWQRERRAPNFNESRVARGKKDAKF